MYINVEKRRSCSGADPGFTPSSSGREHSSFFVRGRAETVGISLMWLRCSSSNIHVIQALFFLIIWKHLAYSPSLPFPAAFAGRPLYLHPVLTLHLSPLLTLLTNDLPQRSLD